MTKTSAQIPNDAVYEGSAPIAYSIADAVKVSGIGRTTLYALIGSQTLPSVKIGSRRLIRRIDLEDLFELNILRAAA